MVSRTREAAAVGERCLGGSDADSVCLDRGWRTNVPLCSVAALVVARPMRGVCESLRYGAAGCSLQEGEIPKVTDARPGSH